MPCPRGCVFDRRAKCRNEPRPLAKLAAPLWLAELGRACCARTMRLLRSVHRHRTAPTRLGCCARAAAGFVRRVARRVVVQGWQAVGGRGRRNEIFERDAQQTNPLGCQVGRWDGLPALDATHGALIDLQPFSDLLLGQVKSLTRSDQLYASSHAGYYAPLH